MMDSDEDDIYPEHNETNGQQHHPEVKMEDVEDGEEEGEEVEDSDVCNRRLPPLAADLQLADLL